MTECDRCSWHNYGRITLDDTKQHLITIAKFSNKEAVGQSGKFGQMVKINLGFKCETSSQLSILQQKICKCECVMPYAIEAI